WSPAPPPQRPRPCPPRRGWHRWAGADRWHGADAGRRCWAWRHARPGMPFGKPGPGDTPRAMRAVWALSDLHLSTSGSKPMDVFGDHWGDHAGRMAANWDATVADYDIVVTPGDFSWANKPAEAAGDFAWLAARPGHKVLVKGNHDHWWPGTQKKLLEMLPERTHALKKTAVIIGDVGFCGARGGAFAPLTRYGDTRTQADIEAWLEREEHELTLSIAALDALEKARGSAAAVRICCFHYPPIPPGRQQSRF